jgi:hypothetical protein
MNRRLVGALRVGLGIVLIALSFLVAHQTCPGSPPFNGTGPPPPVNQCSEYLWTGMAFLTVGSGIVYALLGGALALSRRPEKSTEGKPPFRPRPWE